MEIRLTENLPPKKRVVGTQVSDEIYTQLKKEAQDEFMSMSDLLRKLIIIHLREKKGDAIGQ